MPDNVQTLSGRREFLFLYDIKMGNPNGDPDENRPRVLPDGTHYVTDVRLKRFVRDFLKTQGKDILVDNIEGRTTNLTGRVVHYLQSHNMEKATGAELVNILLDSFIDARLFGSSFAFKAEKVKGGNGKEEIWEPKPEPKTLTGAVQINMGEVLHEAEEVDIHGTSIFGSAEEKTQGTFTTYFALRYALIGFSGIANEHSAEISRLTDEDYDLFLRALWHGVRSAANTRTKVGQIPHLLLSIEYKPGEEFQFGRLHDYVKPRAANDKPEKSWTSPEDYTVDLSVLLDRVNARSDRIQKIRYAKSSDIKLNPQLPDNWEPMDIERL
ncbi:MAG: type I-B CRISPR-associated protein Cas7/Csh2 [Deltaproteobacteria bacterium]|nr:type I-B CRISPR-associated protein Cas7/Csh2 [Deltaproteobacteria bacterium]